MPADRFHVDARVGGSAQQRARESANPQGKRFLDGVPSRRRAAPTRIGSWAARACCLRVRRFAATRAVKSVAIVAATHANRESASAEKSEPPPTPGQLHAPVFNGTFAQGLTGWFERR
jgi:hypothetical protein